LHVKDNQLRCKNIEIYTPPDSNPQSQIITSPLDLLKVFIILSIILKKVITDSNILFCVKAREDSFSEKDIASLSKLRNLRRNCLKSTR